MEIRFGLLGDLTGRLLQENLLDDPWRMLVACVLLNKTGGETVRRVLPPLFGRWPSAEEMSSARASDIVGYIRECGLQNRKARLLIEMSRAYQGKGWIRVEELPGIGEYAGDCWRILVEGRTDLTPRDKALRSYLKRLGDR